MNWKVQLESEEPLLGKIHSFSSCAGKGTGKGAGA